MPDERKCGKSGKQEPDYEPTQEQIAEATAEIRKTWTPAEHRRRAGQKTERELKFANVEYSKPTARIRLKIDHDTTHNPFL